MENNTKIPLIPFYFVRHGETDWNKLRPTTCCPEDITLNETGLEQARKACTPISSLGITQICSSPLLRTKQTADIINSQLQVPLAYHEGLRENMPEKVAIALEQILTPSHTTLIVSHGEVYRLLLRILHIQDAEPKAKNCGVNFFSPPQTDSNHNSDPNSDPNYNKWSVLTIANNT